MSSLHSGFSPCSWKVTAQMGRQSTSQHLLGTIVLSLTTGLVSPQFHVVFDDHFQTVCSKGPGAMQYRSDWQGLAGFELELAQQQARKTKQGGQAARMVAQVLYHIFPGPGRELEGYDGEASGEADVTLPEGADASLLGSHQQHQSTRNRLTLSMVASIHSLASQDEHARDRHGGATTILPTNLSSRWTQTIFYSMRSTMAP
jgi:hypothetical protein